MQPFQGNAHATWKKILESNGLFKILFHLAAPQSIWDLSSLIQDQTHAPALGRQCLNHQSTREVPESKFCKPWPLREPVSVWRVPCFPSRALDWFFAWKPFALRIFPLVRIGLRIVYFWTQKFWFLYGSSKLRLKLKKCFLKLLLSSYMLSYIDKRS